MLEQFWFPGWQVAIDGVAIPEEQLAARVGPHGFLAFDVPAGSHVVEARYAGPPGRRRQAAGALAVLVSCAAIGARLRRTRPRPG
ncbi:MAG: hypothetical protein HYV09_33035 [Deltaproteobacteria bacterium]|nr:hypothetical protein [Deltaproteobacteria bacterium]